jgi:hypothetical protein
MKSDGHTEYLREVAGGYGDLGEYPQEKVYGTAIRAAGSLGKV